MNSGREEGWQGEVRGRKVKERLPLTLVSAVLDVKTATPARVGIA